MKKYRLIKYDVTGRRIEHGTETFSSLEEAAKQMLERSEITYRIEEVEESIMDRVKTVEDAFAVQGYNGVYQFIFKQEKADGEDSFIPLSRRYLRQAEVLFQLSIITAALNEGWKPDWENQSQKKWIVWYSSETEKCKASDQSVCCMTSSRLYFKSSELAEYAAKQFAELYKKLLIEKF